MTRSFIGGWWHAADTALAYEQLADYLGALELEPLPLAELQMLIASVGDGALDEDELRRHQIGTAARHANQQLAQLGRPERVRAFGERDTGDDEPAWFVVTPDDHARLLAEHGPPGDPERAYDDADAPRPRPAFAAPSSRLPRRVGELFAFAEREIAAQRYAVAIAALERLLATGYAADDVVLVELAHISALRSAGRHADAVAAWTSTADRWLAGERKVWRSQWVTLEKLHRKLRLPDGDPRLVAVRERQASAPR
jgi:hypothetical protein